MARNQFDQLNGWYDEGDLGFLKKIAKSVTKSVEKVASKVVKPVVDTTKKVVTTTVNSTVKSAQSLAKGDIKGAVTNAAKAALAAPIVTTQETAKAVSPILARPEMKIVAGVVSAIPAIGPLVGAGVGLANAAATTYEQKKEYEKELRKAQPYVDQYAGIQNNVNQDEFNQFVAQMRARGMSDEQIKNEWLTSQTYREIAVPYIANTLAPSYAAALNESGVVNSAEVAKNYAAKDAVAIVDKEAAKAESSKIMPALLLGVGALLAAKGL